MGVIEFPPHVKKDENTNKCVGKFVSISKKILSEYGIDFETVCAPPIRIYRLLESGAVDFTINIKSTEALPKDIVFVEPPFSTLSLNLYSHKQASLGENVAAIRGFSYHGYRSKLVSQGYEFFDLPTSISAIQMFVKKRSSNLISYRAPVEYYIAEKGLEIKDNVRILPLTEIPTYIAISGQSKHLELIKSAFDDYAKKHQLAFFSPPSQW
mgnify:CR=1 FL=1